MTIYSDALGKQTNFNNALLSKLQELATAVGNRVRSADLYDGNGKIKSNLLPFAINDLLEMKGALSLQYDPTQITSGSGSKDGEIYIVTEAATGLTIDDITAMAVAHHAQLKLNAKNIDIAKQQKEVTRLKQLPDISASATGASGVPCTPVTLTSTRRSGPRQSMRAALALMASHWLPVTGLLSPLP